MCLYFSLFLVMFQRNPTPSQTAVWTQNEVVVSSFKYVLCSPLFYFHPYLGIFGKMIYFDKHIFQMGWLKPPTWRFTVVYTWHLGLVSVRRPPALQVSSGNHGSYRMRNKPCTTSSLGSLDFRWGDGLVGRFQWVTLSVCVCVFLVCQKESHWFGGVFCKITMIN